VKGVGSRWLGHDRSVDELAQHHTHKYDYVADVSNENAAAAKVVRFVGTSKRVLEIGSGPGAITRVLAEVNGCTVTAVEIDEESARRVAGYCEQVLSCDLNDPSWVDEVRRFGPFDVVVAADVLEHLVDPWAVLLQIKSLLSADGAVVISLPHAGHNAVIASLLDADFEYRRIGLLDRTHVRFFGLKNIQQLFDGAALAIVEASFVGKLPTETELKDHWTALPAKTRRVLEGNPYGAIYQVVVKAVPVSRGVAGVDLRHVPHPDPRTPMRDRIAAVLDRSLGPRVGSWLRRLLKTLVGGGGRPPAKGSTGS
jgi:2-polyprenyl-3-methyl-5-hydroxy-6-metoxy-1,4-benzoquinol methylase